MDEQTHRACARCGAESPAGAGFCWKCYASFAPQAAVPVGRPAMAGGMPPPPVPAAPGAPAGYRPGAARPMGPFTNGSTPPPAPVLPGSTSRSTTMVLRLVLSGLGFLGGWFAVDRLVGPDFSIPDSIAGAERIEGRDAEEFETGVNRLDDQTPGKVDGGLYEAAEMVFYVIVLDAPSGTDYEQDFRDFITGFQMGAGTAMSVDTEAIETTVEGGVTYLCAPVDAGELQSGICMWRDGEVAGVVQSFDPGGGTKTRPLTAQAHAAVQD